MTVSSGGVPTPTPQDHVVRVQLVVIVGDAGTKAKLSVNQTYTGTGTDLADEVRAAITGMTDLAHQMVTQRVCEEDAP